MKILITFALEMEFAPWRSLHSFAKICDDAGAYEGKFGGAVARVVLTGVGGVNAKRAMRGALEWKPGACISSGLAGSLRAECRVGQVFAAREVMEIETGRSAKADAQMLRRAAAQNATTIEKLLTSAEMILSREAKARLGKVGEAVEMESFAVLAEAEAAGVPAISIRAISDGTNESLPLDFGKTLGESGNVNPSKISSAIARAPHKLPALVRLARNSNKAARKLAQFLEGYVSELSTGWEAQVELAGAKRA